MPGRNVAGMLAYISELLSWLAGRFPSRAELELEVIALRHQLAVLRRQLPGRTRLFTLDRLLWIWLYRVWPRCLNIMLLVKPATVVRWHRQGFQLYWRWRSKSGRPSVYSSTLLKLGIKVSQAMVAKYMVRRIGTPSPTWRSFLRNEAIGIAAIDMFVALSASFRLLYVMIILAHDRRKIVRFDVTQHPTAVWLSQQVIEAFPWETAPSFLLRDRDASYSPVFSKRVAAMGVTQVVTAPRSPWRNAYVERVIGSIRRECLDQVVSDRP